MNVLSINVNSRLGDKNNNVARYNTTNRISFKNLIKAIQIERNLKKNYNMDCNFRSSGFVAECTMQVVKLFNELFGRSSLPDSAEFLAFSKKFGEDDNTLGMHVANFDKTNAVFFNSDCKCFKTKNKLKFGEMSQKLIWWHPTGHYLQTFVHEFAHSAHYKNLCENSCPDVMSLLRTTRIPTAVGRLITKFKLGRYSATNMNEFMAERITKDLCKNLNSQDMYVGNKKNIDYAKIFSNKWQYRYSSPQSYLDYYTQQVWNGDIEEAKNIAGEIEIYLKEIEAKEVLPVVQTVKEKVPKKSFWALLADGLYNLNKSFTNNLDARNRLHMKDIE